MNNIAAFLSRARETFFLVPFFAVFWAPKYLYVCMMNARVIFNCHFALKFNTQALISVDWLWPRRLLRHERVRGAKDHEITQAYWFKFSQTCWLCGWKLRELQSTQSSTWIVCRRFIANPLKKMEIRIFNFVLSVRANNFKRGYCPCVYDFGARSPT